MRVGGWGLVAVPGSVTDTLLSLSLAALPCLVLACLATQFDLSIIDLNELVSPAACMAGWLAL